MNPKTRRLLIVGGFIVAIPLIAWVGYSIVEASRVTADKVSQYANDLELNGLKDGAARAEALSRLEAMILRLSPEERRKWQRGGAWVKIFHEMSEREKDVYIEATMPSDFKQWLNSFDGLPLDERRKYIDLISEHLRSTHELMTDHEPGQTIPMDGTNTPPQLSAELERRAWTIGLKNFYTESSAETKAELAPFLEELQHETQHPNVNPDPP